MGKRNRLAATQVAGIVKRAKRGWYPDGGGLYLQISDRGTASWAYRFSFNRKERWMGLGSFDDFGLADARERADEMRKQLKAGTDPLGERDERRLQAQIERARRITFDDAADKFIAAHEPSWKNTKHIQQWHNSLKTYVRPILGPMPVSEIETGDIIRIIEPIWKTKTETASRVRGRIEKVLDWARAHGYREGTNPAAWKGHLELMLPAKGKIAAVKHHPAMPYEELPGFIKQLRAQDAISARALEFTIMTGARTSEVTGATLAEFNMNSKTWTIPAARTKSGKEHTVPLTDRMLEIMQDAKGRNATAAIFVNPSTGMPLSNMAMAELLKGMRPDVSVHGFRSTFRTWLAEQTHFPHDLCELALGHAIKDGVVKAYKRTDLLERRRKMMWQWEVFCNTPHRGQVVPLKRA